jgi:dinuclear metal center YbgI/SA1388 family protein
MASLKHITTWLDDLLQPRDFSDYCLNGLQVEGAAEVQVVITGVSICLELIESAVQKQAQMVLVHHGLFWKNDRPFQVRGSMRSRLIALLSNNISLVAYHLPLDAHPEVGNNAIAAQKLELIDPEPFGTYRGRPIGYAGKLPSPLSPEALGARLDEIYGREPLCLKGQRQQIERVGIISGGAAMNFSQAIKEGLDAYITGEPAEPSMHLAREEGVHFYACGHDATERFGVQALGEQLQQRFGVQTLFQESLNPV